MTKVALKSKTNDNTVRFYQKSEYRPNSIAPWWITKIAQWFEKRQQKKALRMFGAELLAEFNKTDNEQLAFELAIVAWKHQTPQVYEMIDQYDLKDFKWLF